MRTARCHWLFFGMTILCPGCLLARDVARTNITEPAAFPTHLEHDVLCLRAHKMAERAWKEVQASGGLEGNTGNDLWGRPPSCPNPTLTVPSRKSGGRIDRHSDPYRQGFIAGFSDYVQYGGSGEPPALPPRCYWAKTTVEGRQAAEDWFAGFRHGAGMARQSGVRNLVLVPASTSIHDAESHGSATTAPPQPGSPEPLVMPAPRVVEPVPVPRSK